MPLLPGISFPPRLSGSQELTQRQLPGKLATTGERRGRRSTTRLSTPTIGVTSTNLRRLTSLRIRLGKKEAIAYVDSCSSDNLIHAGLLTDEQLRRLNSSPPYAKLAAEGSTLKLIGSMKLSPEIGGEWRYRLRDTLARATPSGVRPLTGMPIRRSPAVNSALYYPRVTSTIN